MWSKISSALKPREGNDSDTDHSDVQSTARSPPDPFRINATTYYTHQTPPTPPPGAHSRTVSREEDIIWSLRTQLALQRELCAQFEIDLGARDELVEALTLRLEASEKENDKRKSVVRSWKKKAADLEKMCRHLEEEVDNSRQESMERSIMDEASGEALRQLHRQISQLEREKTETDAERDSLAQTVKHSDDEIAKLKEELDASNKMDREALCHLQDQIAQLERDKNEIEVERNSLAQALKHSDDEMTNLKEELDASNKADREALHRLHDQIAQLERDKSQVDTERNSLVQAMKHSDDEMANLKEELDASNKADREALCHLHDQITQLERDKSQVEAERNSLAQAMKHSDDEIVKLREELDAANEVNREALCRLHDQIAQLERDKSEVEVERNSLAQTMKETQADVLRLGNVETERDNVSSEISQLRAHIQQLQKNSAIMEVTIVQLNKQLDQDKEDIDGLNIALESKQQELELVRINPRERGSEKLTLAFSLLQVKRKHGARGTIGPTPGRTNVAPSTAGFPAVQPSKVLRTSAVGTRTSSPVPPRVPSALGRAANTRPSISSALRRTSSSSVESKTKPSSRRASIASMPTEADEKENASTPIPAKHQRRTMVPV